MGWSLALTAWRSLWPELQKAWAAKAKFMLSPLPTPDAVLPTGLSRASNNPPPLGTGAVGAVLCTVFSSSFQPSAEAAAGIAEGR